jgi:hypothetical protein
MHDDYDSEDLEETEDVDLGKGFGIKDVEDEEYDSEEFDEQRSRNGSTISQPEEQQDEWTTGEWEDGSERRVAADDLNEAMHKHTWQEELNAHLEELRAVMNVLNIKKFGDVKMYLERLPDPHSLKNCDGRDTVSTETISRYRAELLSFEEQHRHSSVKPGSNPLSQPRSYENLVNFTFHRGHTPKPRPGLASFAKLPSVQPLVFTIDRSRIEKTKSQHLQDKEEMLLFNIKDYADNICMSLNDALRVKAADGADGKEGTWMVVEDKSLLHFQVRGAAELPLSMLFLPLRILLLPLFMEVIHASFPTFFMAHSHVRTFASLRDPASLVAYFSWRILSSLLLPLPPASSG